jgi:hypothetical protein
MTSHKFNRDAFREKHAAELARLCQQLREAKPQRQEAEKEIAQWAVDTAKKALATADISAEERELASDYLHELLECYKILLDGTIDRLRTARARWQKKQKYEKAIAATNALDPHGKTKTKSLKERLDRIGIVRSKRTLRRYRQKAVNK